MRWAIVAAVVGLAGCGGDPATVNAILGIEPAKANVAPGAILQFVATQASGPAMWTIGGVGTVDQVGIYRAPSCAEFLAGISNVATVTVSAGGQSASAVVTVVDPVTSVSISPPAVTVPPGAVVQFVASVKTGCRP